MANIKNRLEKLEAAGQNLSAEQSASKGLITSR